MVKPSVANATPSIDTLMIGFVDVSPPGYSQVISTSINWSNNTVATEASTLLSRTLKLSSLIRRSKIAPPLLVDEL